MTRSGGTTAALSCLSPVAAIILLVCGCTALVQRNAPPVSVLRDELPGWAVIGTTAGQEIVLWTPRVQGDSLVVGSHVANVGDHPDPPDLVGIPLEEIAWIATREPDDIGQKKVLANGIAFAGFLLLPFIYAFAVGFR